MRLLLFLSLSFTGGVLLSSGYWMTLMWEEHHNPFFPFLNNIFQSPDFAAVNWRDTRFLPHGIWQTLFFPFYFSWDGRTADGYFRDFRFAIVYVLIVLFYLTKVTAQAPFWKRRLRAGLVHIQEGADLLLTKPFIIADKKKKPIDDKTVAFRWLLTFFIFSYVLWQFYFSIARYLTPLEMLAPLLIYLLVLQIPVRPYLHHAAIILLFYSLFFFMSPISVARARWYETTFFNVKLPAPVLQKNEALVLIAYSVYMKGKPWLDANPRPQAYLIPYFPKQWRFIGIPFGHEKYLDDANFAQKIRELIQTNSYPVYLLTSNVNMPELYRTARLFGLTEAGTCEKITSDRQKITGQEVLLCPVKW